MTYFEWAAQCRSLPPPEFEESDIPKLEDPDTVRIRTQIDRNACGILVEEGDLCGFPECLSEATHGEFCEEHFMQHKENLS